MTSKPETFRVTPEIAIGLGGARDELLAVPPWLTHDEEAELRTRFGEQALEEARQRWQKYRSTPTGRPATPQSPREAS